MPHPSRSSTHFQHQDWLGTERLRTTYNGAVEGSFTSLPFGDAYAASGSDADPYHYAQLDYDSETNTDHAQFRQYNSTQGRWMRPDPYYGSYDFSNPQSFNRYSYVLNNPLRNFDPSGLILCDYGPSDDGGEDYEDEGSDDECISSGGTPAGVYASVSVSADGSGSLEIDYIDLTGTMLIDYEKFAPSKDCTVPSLLPHSGAIVAGGEATLGVVATGASASAEGGIWASLTGAHGLFGTASAFANYGSNYSANVPQRDTPIAFGAYAGFGAGIMVSNATNASQLSGAFEQYTLSLPAVSIAFSFGNGIWTLQATGGPGAVLAHTYSTSNTAVPRDSVNHPCS